MVRGQVSGRQSDSPGAGYPARVLERVKGWEGISGPLALQNKALWNPLSMSAERTECQKLVEEAGHRRWQATGGRSDRAEVKGVVACIDREANVVQETAISEEVAPMPIRRNAHGGLDTDRFPLVCNYGQRGSLKTTINLTMQRGHRHRLSVTTQERQGFGNLGIQHGPSCTSIQLGEDYAIERLSLDSDENLMRPFR